MFKNTYFLMSDFFFLVYFCTKVIAAGMNNSHWINNKSGLINLTKNKETNGK